MDFLTILFIIIALIISVLVAGYQYLYKCKEKSKVVKLLFVVRTLVIFTILMLLLNPKVVRNTYQIIKPILVIAVDNSRSISELGASQTAVELKDKLSLNNDLKQKFDVQVVTFDNQIGYDSINFKGNHTRIDKLGKELKAIHKNKTYPTILLSDGNQTMGEDYLYAFDQRNAVYPVVLGDTLMYADLKIDKLNANRYVYLKNKFPIEVLFSGYTPKEIATHWGVRLSGQTIFREKINFNKNQNTFSKEIHIEATKVGRHVYEVFIENFEGEVNTYNNVKKIVVEVIDQKKQIAIISSINHPDLGMFRRAIESVEQHQVNILKPEEVVDLNKYDAVIVYQPNQKFQKIFEQLNKNNISYFAIAGKHTDYQVFNNGQSLIKINSTVQTEDFTALYRADFTNFVQTDLGFSRFPPLEQTFSNIEINKNIQILLESKIRGINTEKPMLFFSDINNQRVAVLLGEGIWRWRLQHFVQHNSFEEFDLFINKIMQFLSTQNNKRSLIVNHEDFYYQGDNITISAQYFNKNYEFEHNAKLTISIKNKEDNQTKMYDLFKANNHYRINLDGLTPGEYLFVVQEESSKQLYNGAFEVIDFDLEKQFVNANYAKLSNLAAQTQGKVFLPTDVDNLIKHLAEEELYKSVQKQQVKKSPLVYFWALLLLLVTLLSIEWFVRKFNGLL
ncbi:MAG: hypothetical protein Q4B43_08620 [Bacteroidota bacterium]|nr:hypothetical protein [Bacteroidota bacterium]